MFRSNRNNLKKLKNAFHNENPIDYLAQILSKKSNQLEEKLLDYCHSDDIAQEKIKNIVFFIELHFSDIEREKKSLEKIECFSLFLLNHSYFSCLAAVQKAFIYNRFAKGSSITEDISGLIAHLKSDSCHLSVEYFEKGISIIKDFMSLEQKNKLIQWAIKNLRHKCRSDLCNTILKGMILLTILPSANVRLSESQKKQLLSTVIERNSNPNADNSELHFLTYFMINENRIFNEDCEKIEQILVQSMHAVSANRNILSNIRFIIFSLKYLTHDRQKQVIEFVASMTFYKEDECSYIIVNEIIISGLGKLLESTHSHEITKLVTDYFIDIFYSVSLERFIPYRLQRHMGKVFCDLSSVDKQSIWFESFCARMSSFSKKRVEVSGFIFHIANHLFAEQAKILIENYSNNITISTVIIFLKKIFIDIDNNGSKNTFFDPGRQSKQCNVIKYSINVLKELISSRTFYLNYGDEEYFLNLFHAWSSCYLEEGLIERIINIILKLFNKIKYANFICFFIFFFPKMSHDKVDDLLEKVFSLDKKIICSSGKFFVEIKPYLSREKINFICGNMLSIYDSKMETEEDGIELILYCEILGNYFEKFTETQKYNLIRCLIHFANENPRDRVKIDASIVLCFLKSCNKMQRYIFGNTNDDILKYIFGKLLFNNKGVFQISNHEEGCIVLNIMEKVFRSYHEIDVGHHEFFMGFFCEVDKYTSCGFLRNTTINLFHKIDMPFIKEVILKKYKITNQVIDNFLLGDGDDFCSFQEVSETINILLKYGFAQHLKNRLLYKYISENNNFSLILLLNLLTTLPEKKKLSIKSAINCRYDVSLTEDVSETIMSYLPSM
jgi:hypothetical protein